MSRALALGAGAAIGGALILLLFQPARPPAPPPAECRVEHVFDGDSLRCAGGEQVRLLLIDSPERDQGPAADAARAFAARLMPRGTSLRLETDAEPRDTHGRVLAYAWLPDGRMVNEELVRAGQALYYAFRGRKPRHADRIAAAEAEAQRLSAGFWQDGPVRCRPVQFRHRECRGFQ